MVGSSASPGDTKTIFVAVFGSISGFTAAKTPRNTRGAPWTTMWPQHSAKQDMSMSMVSRVTDHGGLLKSEKSERCMKMTYFETRVPSTRRRACSSTKARHRSWAALSFVFCTVLSKTTTGRPQRSSDSATRSLPVRLSRSISA